MRDDSVAVDMLVADLRSIFGPRLRSVVVYGERTTPRDPRESPIHTFAAVDAVTFEDLQRCARSFDRWTVKGLAAPLLLSGDEFARSLDAFPLEYGAILDDHRLVFGRDPFDGMRVRAEDLRRACEVQAKSHLLHLREAFMETGGRETEISDLIAASAPSFRVLLQHVARLHGADSPDVEALVAFGESIRLAPHIVRVVVSLRGPRDLGPIEAERIFPAYLDTAERLARFVDTWKAE